MAQTVLITGGSRGIGSATAVLFGKKGYQVAVNYKNNQDAAEKTALEITNNGGTAEIFKADVSENKEVTAMIQQVSHTFGDIDIMVNNAGIAQQKLFTDITIDEWKEMIDTNLSSVFYCCHGVLPSMLKNHHGRIINISSIWGETGGSCEVHYSAAKAGVIGLTKALAKEVAPSGITVNCITPGVILTDMMQGFDEHTLKELTNETPVGRLGTPLDVAQAVYTLASEKSSFITGQVLGVNGGFV